MIDRELFPAEASRTEVPRLFCFPHAGGGSSAFFRWRRFSGKAINIVPARLPGRESRLKEPPVASMDDLAATVAETIASLPAGPFALLGYSVGAHLAHQVARRLPRFGFLGYAVGRHAPGAREGTPALAAAQEVTPVEDLPDEQLVEHIHQKYGGIPAVVRNDPSWLAAIVPALRADLRMLRSQSFETGELLECPLLAVGGVDDQYVTAAGLLGWSAVTRGSLTMQQFPGGHFFLYQDFNALPAGVAGKVPVALATVFEFVRKHELRDRGAC